MKQGHARKGFGATRMWGRVAAVVLLLAEFLAAANHAGAACKSTCTDELRACRARCLKLADRRACRRACGDASTCTAPGVRLRTIAYSVTECREEAAGVSFHERLVVRRGNCDPVTVMELSPVGPTPEGMGLCQLYGQLRLGGASVVVGRLQRIGVTPDATGLIIEITNDHSVFPGPLSPEPPEEGIFYLRTDGRTLPDGKAMRKIGTPSALQIVDGTFTQIGNSTLVVSPNSRLVAFEDRGPDSAGHDAEQIFVIDLTNDEGKRQITHLPAARPGGTPTGFPFFADDHTILFVNGAAGRLFSVGTDGSRLRPLQDPVAPPDAEVVPQFAIIRGSANVVPLRFPGRTPVDHYPGDGIVRELFVVDGPRELQLTTFGYSDTGGIAAPGRDRIFFAASADPLGQNPQGICQLFSVTPFGAHLRQLTRFPEDGEPKNGCQVSLERSACTVTGLATDPVTGILVFVSSCDPLGRTRNGEQFFTMRPDGTGLRQISAFRGVEPLPGGGVQVEMSGGAAYSFVVR